MKNPLKKAARLAIEACGYRIFPKDTFYHNFVPYTRYGSDLIHYLRHFADVDGIKTCFDVGANRGQTAAYFSAIFPSASIYSFEPVSGTFSLLAAKFRDSPRVRTFNFAFGQTPGTVAIPLAENDQLNSLVAVPGRSLSTGIAIESVQVRTVDTFMDEHELQRIELLKTDTEGFDLEVLRGASKALERRRIDLIYCEVGFQPDDSLHTYFDSVLKFVAGYEFMFLGLYDTVFCDNPSQILHANALFGRKGSALLKPWAD